MFVGQLDGITENHIQQTFGEQGNIENINMVKEPNGKPDLVENTYPTS